MARKAADEESNIRHQPSEDSVVGDRCLDCLMRLSKHIIPMALELSDVSFFRRRRPGCGILHPCG